MLIADPGLAVLGGGLAAVGLRPDLLRLLLAVATLGLGGVVGFLGGAPRLTAGRAPLAAVAGALGMAGALAITPAVAVLGSGLVLAAGSAVRPRRAIPCEPVTPALSLDTVLRGLAATIAAAAAGLVVLAVRVPTDPSPRLLALALAGAAAGLALGRAGGGRRLGPHAALTLAGLVAGALALAAPHLLGLVRLAVVPTGEGSPELPRLLLLDLPGVVAAGLGGLLVGVVTSGSARGGTTAATGAVLGIIRALAGAGAGLPGWSVLAGAAALILFLVGGARGAAGGTVVALVAGAAVLRGGLPPADALSTGLARSLRSVEAWDRDHAWRRSLETVGAEWGAGPGAVVRVPLGAGAVGGAAGVDQAEVEVEGRVALLRGRAASAEALAGHLVALLAPRRDRVIVLGDDAGNAFGALSQHPVGAVEIATPAPMAVRALATVDKQREAAWLAPQVRLRPLHPELALRSSRPPAAVIEILRAPWADAARAAPDGAHFRTVARLLDDYGIYVLVLHLDAWSEGQPPAAVAALAEHFEVVQLWLPPDGADSLILVASQAAVPARRLSSRFAELEDPRALLRVSRPEGLAALAIGDRETALEWAEAARSAPTDRLGAALLAAPVLHLGALADRVAPPDRTWDLDAAELNRPELQGQLDVRRDFLRLLDQAVRGDMAQAFQTARSLQPVPGQGPGPLAAITGPQLEKSRAALARAVAEGPDSASWGVAESLAETVRMLDRSSPEPLLILGEISLAQGDLGGAQDRFERALELQSDSLPALNGLARVARARRAPEQAEAHLRRAVAARPQDWRTWQNLGTFLLEARRMDDAEDTLGRAVGLAEGQHPSPNLALAELMLERGRPSGALVHAQRAQVIAPTAYGHYLLGRAHYDMDRLDEAEASFRAAVLADPQLLEARGAIGTIRAQKGDLEAAATQFRAVLQADADNAQARENLERIRQRLEARPTSPVP
jgi:tetratricopeptide (TPR) repeat protein